MLGLHHGLSSRGPPHRGPVRSSSCPAVSEDKWSIGQLLNSLHHLLSPCPALPSSSSHPPLQCFYLTLRAKNLRYRFSQRPRVAVCGDSFLKISWWSLKCLWIDGVLFSKFHMEGNGHLSLFLYFLNSGLFLIYI